MAVEAGTDPPGDGRDGSLGYKRCTGDTRRCSRGKQRWVWDAAAVRQPRPTPRPVDAPPQTGFLGGLRVKELATASSRRSERTIPWGGLRSWPIICCLPSFRFLFDCTAGFLPIPNLLERIIASLAMVLPGEAVTLLQDNIRQLVTEQKGGLLSFGILAALWVSSSAVVAITAALNQAYDVEEGRPWWKVRGIALLLTMGLSLFLLLAVALLIFGPQLGRGLASLVGLGSVFQILWNILRWPVSVGLLVVALALVYYFAPDVERKWKWITPGAIFAVGDPAHLARFSLAMFLLWVL